MDRKNADFFINETEYGDFPKENAVRHLSEAIRFKTISYVDTSRIDYGEFDGFIDWMKNAYPNIFSRAEKTVIGHSILLKLAGSDNSLEPAMFIAHEDIVPVIEGTEMNWKHEPFSGDVADGFIWGRGSIDIKNMLVAELEAADYMLSCGKIPVRPLWFAFGEDEETLNTGAEKLGKMMLREGIRLCYVLDEGVPVVRDAEIYGAPGVPFCPIDTFEKGYADLYLRAYSTGGHSSDPVHGTSLGHLAEAITKILNNMPKPELPQCCLDQFTALRDAITEEPMKTYASNPAAHKDELLKLFSDSDKLYWQVKTTAAPTMIKGGAPAGNVMPQDMEAVINFRLCPQDTTESLLDHVKSLIDPSIEVGYVQCINASIPSRTDTAEYRMLVEALEHFYKDIRFIPMINRGTTDAHNYECVCSCCWRIAPFLVENEVQTEGMHGTNERISEKAFIQGIRVLIRFMENTVFN